MKYSIIASIILVALLPAFGQGNTTTGITDYIKTETVDGELDFMKALEREGKSNSLLIYNGIAYNSKDYSILLWGQAVKKLGLRKVKDAVVLWENIYRRDMTKTELNALKNGFRVKIE